MRIYETIYICPPNISAEAIDDFSDLVREMIYENGGKIIKQDEWGKKRLAYVIKGFNEGVYFYFLYGGEKVDISEVERRLRIADECIRFLTVRLDQELKGKKHKIFTEEEFRLALQMEPKRRKRYKSAKKKIESGKSEETAKPEAEETVDSKAEEAVEADVDTQPEAEPVVEETVEKESVEAEPVDDSTEEVKTEIPEPETDTEKVEKSDEPPVPEKKTTEVKAEIAELEPEEITKEEEKSTEPEEITKEEEKSTEPEEKAKEEGTSDEKENE